MCSHLYCIRELVDLFFKENHFRWTGWDLLAIKDAIFCFSALNGLQGTFWQIGGTSGPCDWRDIKKFAMAGHSCWTVGQQAADCRFVLLSEHYGYYYIDDKDDPGPEECHMSDVPSRRLCVLIKSELGNPCWSLMALMECFTMTIHVRWRALFCRGNKHWKNLDWPLDLPCNRNRQTQLVVFINQRH